MESKQFDSLRENLSSEIEHRSTTLERRLEAQQLAAAEVERMKAVGEAYELSAEEIRMLRSFRSFKATCKPGAVFGWQTRPIDAVTIHEDTALIEDPQQFRIGR